jgi:hypothetical protein
VVDSVEKKWVLGWEKKGFVGKNADLWKRFGCLENIKSILNGLKGIIMFKTKGVMN